MGTQTYLGCVPTNINDFIPAGQPAWEPPADADRIFCDRCSQSMWIQAQQKKFLEENPDTGKICFHCAKEVQKNYRSMEIYELSTGKVHRE